MTARNWGASVRGALLAALLTNFDMLNLMESRYILMDSQLALWCAACLLTAQYWWQRLNSHADAEHAFFARYGHEYNSSNAAHAATDRRLMTAGVQARWRVLAGVCVRACASGRVLLLMARRLGVCVSAREREPHTRNSKSQTLNPKP